MATSLVLKRDCGIVSRLATSHIVTCLSRMSSGSNPNAKLQNASSKPQVGTSPDGRTLICWHPEPEFPYEHSTPIPRKMEDLYEGDSALKVQHIKDATLRARPDGPTISELSAMFYTTKHRWFNRPELKYKKPTPPKDRDSL